MVRSLVALITLTSSTALVSAQQQQRPSQQPQQQMDTTPLTPKQPYDDRDARVAILTENTIEGQINLLTLQVQTEADKKAQPLYMQYGAADKALNDWVSSVKKANGWGDDVMFDVQNIRFVRQTAKAALAPAQPRQDAIKPPPISLPPVPVPAPKPNAAPTK